MKKIIYLTMGAFMSITTIAQNAITNGNFESWTSMTFDIPQYYTECSNYNSFYQCMCPANEVKTTNSYHGSFAVQLTTQAGGGGGGGTGYFVNANANGSPSTWTGGVPYTQKPTGIRGYYKSAIPAGDTGLILVNFKKSGSSIGFFTFNLYGTHNAYTLFSFSIPTLTVTPDTIQFGATSSDFKANIAIPGSMLQIDSVSFTGVSSQPANFNGDFENWTSVTLNRPNNWYLGGGGGTNVGVFQTTDKHAGTYAVELKTFLGQRCSGGGNNCHPAAQGGSISTGYYPNNCSGVCTQIGGGAFTNQIDTLCFYYKYAPSGNDTAQAGLNFKKNYTNVTGMGKNLMAAGTYQYVEIPFNTLNPIDTVIVSFSSSNWRDSALTFIGSDLKVDEVHFKSQPLTTGIKTFSAAIGIKIFPNPSNDGNFTVSNVNTFDLVRVYNIYGQEVNATITKENDYAKIQIANSGAYFVTVNARGKITTQKVIVSLD
jgi:hypothetical protein